MADDTSNLMAFVFGAFLLLCLAHLSSNFESHRSHIMGLRWSKHGLTTLLIHGPDPPSDITVFMDVSKNRGPDVSVTTSVKVETTQQSGFSANAIYALLEFFLSYRRRPEINISHFMTVVSIRFSK